MKWQIDLGNSTHDYPAYQDGLIILPANTTFSSYWYAIDATTGQIVWSQLNWWQRLGFKNHYRCLTKDYLVVSGLWAMLVLNIQTGDVLWEMNRAHQTATCSEYAVFSSGTPGGSIQAFDLSTGERLWSGTDPRQSFSSLIYNSEADEIIADAAVIVDPDSGKVLRSFEPSFIGYGSNDQGRGDTDLINQGDLFVGGSVRDARTGQVFHKEDRFQGYTLPTVTEDTIYISDSLEIPYPSGVVALDRNTYMIKWQYEPKHKIPELPLLTLSQVAVLDGVGYVIFSDATLRAFDLETGEEVGYWQPGLFDRWRWPVCMITPPVIGCSLSARTGVTTSEDTLFVSFGDGKLYAFGK